MGMKFLNKKGWHTGSLRNIENVWKAEQKHDAEQKKLEELRKQIHEEREKAEFRELQVQAGLIPRQERLDFLYESGLAVGKGGSSFKELDSLPKTDPGTVAASSSSAAAAAVEKQQPSVPGALFEDKPQSANDTWRKLHSDPLLMIRQREQEALARVKNNPVQMAMIRKSVESKKEKKEKKHKSKKRKKSKHNKHSSSGSDSDRETATLTTEKQRDSRKGSHYDSEGRGEPRSDKRSSHYDSEGRGEPQSDKRSSHYDSDGRGEPRSDKRSSHYDSEGRGEPRSDKRSHVGSSDKQRSYHDLERRVESQSDRRSRDVTSERRVESQSDRKSQDVTPERRVEPRDRRSHVGSYEKPRTYHDAERRVEPHSDRRSHDVASGKPPRDVPNSRHRIPVKLSEEERAAKLREMQMDAELHEEQRFKRLKKAAENDAEEAVKDRASQGRSFLDKAHKSVYGAEKGGSSTIEESVRRRSHYLQGKSATTESNAFRRYH